MRALFVFMKVKKILIDGKEISIMEISQKATFQSVEGEEGVIEAYVSIFGNVDHAGEVVEKGAFSESLSRKLPKAVWSHNWDEIIGKTLVAREDEKGLYVKFQLVLAVQKAKEAYELMKAGAVDEFSIGYSIDESDIDEKGVKHLRKLSLYEYSPVLAGCNPDTVLVSVKSVQSEDGKQEDKPEEKGEVQDVIEERDTRTQKWEKFDGVDKVMSAFWSAYFKEETKVEDFDGMLAETITLLQKLIGTTDVPEEKKKSFVDLLEKGMTESKSGRILSEKNRALIQKAIDAMEAAASPLIDGKRVLETLIEATNAPSEEEGESKVEAHAPRAKNLVLKEVQLIAKQANKVLFRLKRM